MIAERHRPASRKTHDCLNDHATAKHTPADSPIDHSRPGRTPSARARPTALKATAPTSGRAVSSHHPGTAPRVAEMAASVITEATRAEGLPDGSRFRLIHV